MVEAGVMDTGARDLKSTTVKFPANGGATYTWEEADLA